MYERERVREDHVGRTRLLNQDQNTTAVVHKPTSRDTRVVASLAPRSFSRLSRPERSILELWHDRERDSSQRRLRPGGSCGMNAHIFSAKPLLAHPVNHIHTQREATAP